MDTVSITKKMEMNGKKENIIWEPGLVTGLNMMISG